MRYVILALVLPLAMLLGSSESKAQEVSPAGVNDKTIRPETNRGQTSKKTTKKKKTPKFRWVNPLPPNHDPALKSGAFRSPSMGVDVGYVILLPDGYENSDARYPVVYYLHGGRPGSEAKSHRLAPMIRATQSTANVPPAIYVFVNGGPVSHYNMPDQPEAQGADVFVNELIPHIDSTYRTIADRSGRALEGFSQGGRGTMRISLRHPELFCSAAAGGGGYETERRISESGGRESENLKFAEGDNTWDLARRYRDGEYPKLSWMIYVGTKGFNYENNLAYMEFLDSLKIPYQRLVVPGVPHSAVGIYEKEAEAILRFHAANFAAAKQETANDR